MFLITIKPKKGLLIVVVAAVFAAVVLVSILIPEIRLRGIAASEFAAMTEMDGISAEYTDVSEDETAQKKEFIKWVDFGISYAALEKAMSIDIKSHDTQTPVDWVDLLAYLGAKYGGDFSKYKEKDLTSFAEKLAGGAIIEELTEGMKYFAYYREAYGAVLDEFIGDYSINEGNDQDASEWTARYGLKVFSPIAKGYGYGDYDDFGTKRSYGYARRHLGHDMMGSVGTPIVAIESGVVEALGWNQYGGWRIGIRSFDKKRYYYYAHLRKNHPYKKNLKEGDVVKAGDVIGYLGMTGYSTKENVNNIDTPHLHLGMQLIFDESQKEGTNEIWIDVYNIVKLLQKNKSGVYKDEESKDYNRKVAFTEPIIDDYIRANKANEPEAK